MKAKILIVEDQADIRRLIRWALEDGGHTLHEAANAQVALQIIHTLQPDVVLMDVVMPGAISGLEACAKIRQDPTLADTRVVIISASASNADRARAMAAGASAFLAKPFSPAKLAELLEELLAPR